MVLSSNDLATLDQALTLQYCSSSSYSRRSLIDAVGVQKNLIKGKDYNGRLTSHTPNNAPNTNKQAIKLA